MKCLIFVVVICSLGLLSKTKASERVGSCRFLNIGCDSNVMANTLDILIGVSVFYSNGKRLNSLNILQVPSARKCQKECDKDPNCHNFTWFRGVLSRPFCYLFSSCGTPDFGCLHCWSGQRSDECESLAHHRNIWLK